jgi:FKBP-type peptidyl-prolyl cis-trans isomerase 2
MRPVLAVLLLLLPGCLTQQVEMREEGTVNVKEVAREGDFVAGEYSLHDGIEVKQNFSTLLGSGELLPGIERAIVGMAPGEVRRLELPPEEAYGVWNASLARWEPRRFSIPRVVNVSLEEFLRTFGEPEENATFETRILRMRILEVGRGYVLVEREPLHPRVNVTGGVVEITANSTHINHFFTPVLNLTVLDSSGRYVTYRDVNATHVLADRNHPLAGKKLSAEVRLMRLVKRAKLEGMHIAWREDLSGAIREAVAENKPLLLYFYSRECALCEAVDASFSDARLRLLAEKLVFVRLDLSYEAALAERHGVSRAPAVVVLNSSGERLAKLEGEISAQEMTQVLSEFGITP